MMTPHSETAQETERLSETGLHRLEEVTRRSIKRLDALRARVDAGLTALLGEDRNRDPDRGIEDEYEPWDDSMAGDAEDDPSQGTVYRGPL